MSREGQQGCEKSGGVAEGTGSLWVRLVGMVMVSWLLN